MDHPSNQPSKGITTGDSSPHGSARATATKPFDQRRAMIFLLVFAALLSGMYVIGARPRRRQQEALDKAQHDDAEAHPTVNVIHPEKAPAVTDLSLPAEVSAFYETTIFARTSGYLNRWLVDIGDHVKSGQLLAVIETPELDEQLLEARAKVNVLEADVRLAQAQTNFAKLTTARWESAAPEGAVSKQERDEKKAQFANAEARLDAARAQLRYGQSTVKRLELEQSFQKVLAPFDGVITQRHIDVGSLISAGSTANTSSLFTVAQYDRLRVFVRVPQAAAPELRIGMNASITAREFPGKTFTGKVDRSAGAIEPMSRTLKVEVLTPNPTLELLPGMFVTVNFHIERATPPLIIPAGALNLRKAGPQVTSVGPHHHVHFKNVSIARDLGDTVEIASGLRADDWLALNISDEIADGELVNPVPFHAATERVADQSSPPSPKELPNADKTIAARRP